MSENLFTVLGLAAGPADDRRIAAAYERERAACRRRIRDENQRAARQERLIYAYAVLRDPGRRAAYLEKLGPVVRIARPEAAAPAAETKTEQSPAHGKNKPDAVARLCATIDAALIDGRIDADHRRAIHARAHLLGVTRFEAELLIASALRRGSPSEAGDEQRPHRLARLVAACLTIIVVAVWLYARL